VFITPMTAQIVKRLPEGPEWLYELKFDGYRIARLGSDDGCSEFADCRCR
jgi:ATP-dependent DNA ligase